MEVNGNISAIRREFPVTQRFLYFDTAHQAPMAASVCSAFHDFLDESHHAAGPKGTWIARIAGIRQSMANLIGAQADEIAFTKNTSDGLNIAANSIVFQPGDEVLMLEDDHPNNTYAWLNLKRQDVDVRFIRRNGEAVNATTFEPHITESTRVISLSHVTSDSGHRYDLKSIGTMCKKKGLLLVVDAIQSLGTLPVDVKAMGISMMASGCHKGLLVPQGLGLLYVNRTVAKGLRPAFLASSGIANATRRPVYEDIVLRESAACFELGNLNLLHLHGLGAALSLINSIGVDRISGHVLDLGDCLIAHMDRLGIGIVGPRTRVQRSHIYVLNLPGQIWLDYLASKAVRVSRQQGGIRVSFAMFNTVDEINQLAEIISAGPR
jgi:cysteine desulfurase/selenocysteine lyase